jgi:hypothetical protein
MRTLFVLGLVLTCAFMAGWFTINRDGGETTIKINRDEIRNDAKTAINKGRDYLDRNGEPVNSGQGPQNYQQYPQAGDQFAGQGQYGSQPGYNTPQGQYPANQYQPNQYQQGQPVPASWANQPQQTYRQAGYPSQQPANQAADQNGGYYYPQSQQAQRPPAPWETQQQPAQQRPQF